MSGFDWQVQGVYLQDVQRELKALEDNIKERAIRAGLVSVVAPVKRTAKSEAPTHSGDMARAVGHRNINKRQRARLGMRLGEVGTNRRINGRWQGLKGMWQEHEGHVARARHRKHGREPVPMARHAAARKWCYRSFLRRVLQVPGTPSAAKGPLHD